MWRSSGCGSGWLYADGRAHAHRVRSLCDVLSDCVCAEGVLANVHVPGLCVGCTRVVVGGCGSAEAESRERATRSPFGGSLALGPGSSAKNVEETFISSECARARRVPGRRGPALGGGTCRNSV
eukprot:3291700-Prymnesium_polylepis.1